MRKRLMLAGLAIGRLVTLASGSHAAPPAEPAGAADPLLCPVFQALAPGIPGLVDIASDGDVSLAGQPFWDCPPTA